MFGLMEQREREKDERENENQRDMRERRYYVT
jgi:hypothetical protein